jgi:photosystem II stability/assembly factor-like uncharacterized protein
MKRSVRAIAVSLAAPALLVATGSAAATPTVPQVELLGAVSPHRHVFAADMDGDNGVAVGALGTILETIDGGLSWTDASLSAPLALLAVALAGERAVAVGQLGLATVREAGRWVATRVPTEERLLGVDLNTRGLGIAVGAFGTVLRTEDGGFSWKVVDIDWEKFFPSGEEPHVYDVHIHVDDRVTLVGEFGMVLRSDDGGRSWRLLRSGDASLFALKVDGSTAFAVGQDGTVLRSLDEGESWKELDTGVSANLLAAARSPTRRQLLVPGMRSVLYSDDSGDSWHELIHGDFSRGWYGDAIWSERLGGFLLFGHGGQIKSIKGIN